MALCLPSLRAATTAAADNSFRVTSITSDDSLAWCLDQHIQHHGPMPMHGRNNWLAAFTYFCNERGVDLVTLEDESIARWQQADFTAQEISQTLRGIYRREAARHGSHRFQHKSCAAAPIAPTALDLAATPTFPSSVYDTLPGLLQDCIQPFATDRERDVALLGALIVISGCFPKLWGTYAGASVHANLYGFVVAPAASGKGALSWPYRLAAHYHTELVTNSRQAYAEYEAALAQHQQATRGARKNTGTTTSTPPREPPFRQLYVPANISSASLMKALADNDGRGIIFETEADTLSVALKQEHGDFSHLLRKAFHHEACSSQRKTHREYHLLDRPTLSVLLAGTPGQLRTLIPSAEDGLFSRFLFYNFHTPATWRDVSPNGHRDNLSTHFDNLGAYFNGVVGMVREPVEMQLSDGQWYNLNKAGERWIREARADELGIVKRLGLATFRLAMVLTIVRNLEKPWHHPSQLQCSDADFAIALELAEVHRAHALLLLAERQPSSRKRLPAEEKAELARRAQELHAQGVSIRAIGEELQIPSTTVHRLVSQR